LILSRYDSGSERQNPIPREEDLIAQGVPMIIVHFDERGETTSTESYNLENVRPDKYAMEALARALLPEITAFYEVPENQAAFERWQAERRAKGIPPPKPKRRSRSKK